MALSEFGLIEKYFTGLGPAHASVALGIGDDCALLDPVVGQQLALSVDTLVADVHFPANGDPYRIGQRALRVNLSDLAAMGAQPSGFTLAITLPRADDNWLEPFSRGLRDAAQEFGIGLIGGNTTSGPQLVINIQILGLVPTGRALLRSGAQPGDAILVSGTLGDAHAALNCLNVTRPDADQQYFLQRYYQPTPRIALGLALRGLASAAIDVSDGLSADLGHILEQSGVGATIDPALLPLSPALKTHAQARACALNGGDDYELCFTVPPEHLASVLKLAQSLTVPVTRIGTITREREFLARGENGGCAPLTRSGYQHF